MKRFLMLGLLYLCSSGLGVTGKVADDSSGARISIVIAPLAPPVTPVESDFMLIGATELAALPTSGSAYMWMKDVADYSIANSPATGTPTSKSP